MCCQPKQPHSPHCFRFPFADIYIRCWFCLPIRCFSAGNLLCGLWQKQLGTAFVSAGFSLSSFIWADHHQRPVEWIGRTFFPVLEPYSFFTHYHCLYLVRHALLGIKCILCRMVLQSTNGHHSFFGETEKAHRCIPIPF